MEYNLEGLLSKQTYENGNYVNFYYDTLDRLTEKVYNGDSSKKISYYYGNDGSVSYCMDYMENTTTRYVYDLAGRVVKLKVYNGTTFKCLEAKESVTYKYADKTNYVTSVTYTSALGTQTVNYGYGSLATETMPDTVYTVSQNGTEQIEYSFDYLSRLSSRTISPINKTQTYTYKQGGHGSNSTTTQVASVTSDGITTSYTYDSLGNITAIHKNNQLYESYEYDALSQLTKVTTASGDVYEYTYKGSNITSVKLNGSTIKTYSYGNSEWADLLTEYNGESISYDSIGNPLKYRNGMNFTWQNGRQLSGITKSGNSISYTYNADGLRTSKVVNGTTTNYTYIHGRLIGEKTGNNTIIYLYDDNGNKYGLTYNGTSYYYKLNLQGDVIGIYDTSGNTVVEYSYDVWGKLVSVTGSLASTIGQINPIRYRGYYYDTETGFYLTGTRYYDPEIGRFISPDTTDVITATPMALTDKNLYAYCDNNPIVRADHSGEFWNYVIGGVVGAVVGGVSAAISGGDWKAIALGAGVGAVGGLLAASGVPAGFQIVAGGLLSGGNNLATQTLVEGKSLQEVDWIDVGIDTAIGAGTSALSYGVTRNASKAADKIICKGANKVVKGQQSLLSGSRYGKGAIKKGTAIMNSGIKQMNTVRGTSSVVGSTSGGFLTSVKSFFKRLFR